jgi:hypothetical protein
MVDLEVVKEVVRSGALKSVYWSKPAPVILPKDHFNFYEYIAKNVGPEKKIDYLEFGVAQGRSILKFSESFHHPEARFYGFDSFKGLPESWLHHDVGSYSTRGQPPQTDDKRVSFIEGWFQNTLPEFLVNHQTRPDAVTLVHIDSDLYSSCLFVLTMLWPRLDEYFIIFDDFIYDEVVALQDFLRAFPVELQFIAQTQGGGHPPNPDQVFGHVKRIKFELPAAE